MISEQEIYKVLLFEFPYFKKINEEKRTLLCQRTKEFIEGTKFIPRKGMEITNRMKILISACSQQLTLAFKKHYEYAYFDKIVLYPEKYLSTHTGRYHTGEMNTIGVIAFSWEDFHKGISIDNDAHNVGLHEFAHALEYMDIANEDIDERFSACLDKFTALADQYLQHQPDKPLFRSYATTNLSEFFAVATEYYFEAPNEFAIQQPELFTILNRAYQQNTAPKSSRIFKAKKAPITKSDKAIFGSYIPFLNYLGELVLYILISTIATFIGVLSPIVGIIFFVASFYLIITFLFKDSFTLYETYVQIHQPLIKHIVKRLFPLKYNYETVISYSDVLYVSAQEFDFNNDRNLFSELKEGYWYTLCYLQNGKLRYAKQSTTDLEYDHVLRFLYQEKSVGTRVDGSYKKYR